MGLKSNFVTEEEVMSWRDFC